MFNRVNECQGNGIDPKALPPGNTRSPAPTPTPTPPPPSSALPGAPPANSRPQPRSLTSKAPTHRGKCQCDKQPEELVHGLRRGTALALGYEWKHTLQAAARGGSRETDGARSQGWSAHQCPAPLSAAAERALGSLPGCHLQAFAPTEPIGGEHPPIPTVSATPSHLSRLSLRVTFASPLL